MWEILADNLGRILIWSLIATAAMTTIIHGSQGLGLSRLSISFLVGTVFTSRRTYANVLGFVLYALGGWLFAIIYIIVFITSGLGTWWFGAILGLAHGVVLLVVLLPLIPYFHPRMANEYEGPALTQRLEPPGFMGRNYGYRTPFTTILAQAAYGLLLGLCYELGGLPGTGG